VRRLRREPNLPSLSLAEFKALVREQFYMLLIDQEAALGSIPKMLPEDAGARQKGFDIVKRVLTACGPLDDEDQAPGTDRATVRSGRCGGRAGKRHPFIADETRKSKQGVVAN
jgi:hypothetical protein